MRKNLTLYWNHSAVEVFLYSPFAVQFSLLFLFLVIKRKVELDILLDQYFEYSHKLLLNMIYYLVLCSLLIYFLHNEVYSCNGGLFPLGRNGVWGQLTLFHDMAL